MKIVLFILTTSLVLSDSVVKHTVFHPPYFPLPVRIPLCFLLLTRGDQYFDIQGLGDHMLLADDQ